MLSRYDFEGGRNDPCCCGSGEKFKNCCSKLSNRHYADGPALVFHTSAARLYDLIMDKTYDIRIGRHQTRERGLHRFDDAKRKAAAYRAGR